MKQVDFENGKIAQNIARTAFPMLIAQVLSLLYSIVDRIYIGRIPGEGTSALGAVGLCFPVIILITGFTNMFGMGGSPLFSMELGRGNKEKAETIMNTSFRLLVVTALVIMAAGELFAEPLLRLFGASDNAIGYSVVYLRIYLTGTLFSMVTTGMNPFINAQGFPGIGMLSVVVGAVLNLILDPFFIFVLEMGVSGAAVATVISQGCSVIVVARCLFGKKLEQRIYFRKVSRIRDYFPFAGDIVGLGTAPFIMQCTNSLVQIACNSVLMTFGGEIYVSIMTIVSSVRQILDTPVMAVVEGTSPIISYNYGARRATNVRKAIAIMMAVTVPYTFIVWIMILWRPEMFISIFSSDKTLLSDAIPALHLYFFAYIFQALQYSGQTVFKALNKKKQAVFFSLFRKVVMVIPLTYLFPYVCGFGAEGVFMAEPVSNIIGGLACFITMLCIVLPELKKMEAGCKKL
ncbi:MATE efflux family protein [Marvinbryantia formatexigens DSM 14469]|uniref:Multidrug export protein MepA n=1 Tax=Marvinbryantia formatexigens DSM 14469 TaxID=478749 RepID=C6LHY8_9FIRM|nr:MATE family efflux transporter [Marvinbryantia formatexigens]EET59643.1 MATE efflux family protein [Marvinbryantia formatexigens DSM 14469]UWO26692.1 MATE family efflux transporter [Marvinbryantia formatexigens DSM 14469]SDG44079.1 putative efflux protein, MATE family [Marvinbryantia formatexigens]